ncbi:4-alpha-glucanotransferase [Salinicoccus sediminis]|uniref:4-alpha-glucanotransferase n=1 Tax=Salinicoccus sediminis TaxID=1432562 RepID=A0A0M2SKI1_9STAP|nr:4-alpha-glucanotransferase [Salinicoccus sediminis]KKK33352.1 4-alpha-glucanotransferase [Salinicoccus sediminis]
MKKRSSGVLLHVSSLPGKYGIGDFGKKAYKFVRLLARSNTKYWQILPLGVTGFGDSPYQSFSAFAGNPYFIDLDELIEKGWLSEEEAAGADLGDDPGKVDFSKLYMHKMPLLEAAYRRAAKELGDELEVFLDRHSEWLHDFALYMSIKKAHGGDSWMEWPDKYRLREKAALDAFFAEHKHEYFFWVFTQYLFFGQWGKLKEYANERGIRIMGDIPIYVAEDGADIWSQPELYKLDWDLKPTVVAGVPPDMMSDTGQLWGNPIYDWDAMARDGYRWWIRRIEESFKLYDTVRIDHFRGFESYWEIPAGDPTAENGNWVKGPGMDLFSAVKEALGERDIVAEDLGFLTEKVYKLIEETGYPGMKIMQFGFDPGEDSEYLPHNYGRHTIAYTGNHDTQTMRGWLDSSDRETYKKAEAYLNLTEEEGLTEGCIRGVFASHSYLAVIPMQDILGLGEKARFNTPSTIGGNWEWRMPEDALKKRTLKKMKRLNRLYGRSL